MDLVLESLLNIVMVWFLMVYPGLRMVMMKMIHVIPIFMIVMVNVTELQF